MRVLEKLQRIPKFLFLNAIVLAGYGIFVLYSANYANWYPWASKQFIIFCFCLPFSLVIALINLRTIFNFTSHIYFGSIGLLLCVKILGYSAMGATRWLSIAGFKLQPTEPAKIGIILMLSKYLHNLSLAETNSWKHIFIIGALILLPCGLIIIQPDLGSGLLTIICCCMVIVTGGISFKKILIITTPIILSFPVIWNLLHEYQKKRIFIFLNPESDPLGSGYNIIQSKIAIGSGGFWGKGFLKGTQSHLDFLPEHQTDFIFAFIAEEFGFIGAMIIMSSFITLLYQIYTISMNLRSQFCKFLGTGIAALIFCHLFINVGMVTGILPVVGVPLPFISYGGTMMLSMFSCIGIVMNLHVNKNIKF